MKAKSAEFSKFLGAGDPLRLYLFHGVDIGGSHGMAQRLATHLGGEKVRLDSASLKSDPGRIVDEAAGAGLFGDSKLIWVEPAGNDFLTAADALLGAPTTDFPVIAIAGSLTRASKLLKLVEASDQAVAIISYAPDLRSLTRDIEQMMGERGLQGEAGVAARLAEASDLNRDIAAQELAKLQLYLGDDTNITHEAIDAIGADYGDTEWLGIGDAAMDGDIGTVEAALAALSAQATEAVQLLRAMQRRIQMLSPLAARVAAGENPQAVMTSMGKALFWKDKPLIARLLAKWPAAMLARLAERVADAERSMMLAPAARKAALGEELLTIARMAARRR